MSAIYPLYKQALLDGDSDVDVDDGTVKATLVNVTGSGTLYTYSASHQYMTTSDVPSAARIATLTIDNTTVTNGLFETSDDTDTFTAVSGDSAEAIIIWIDTSTPSTSRLVAYIDGISVTPNGGNIDVDWSDATPDGIFQL